MPSSEFLETSGESGGLVFNLPINKVKELGPIFSLIDMQKQGTTTQNQNKSVNSLKDLITDVGVS